MPTVAKPKTTPIHLHFESKQQVVVIPDDKDRFVTSSREAAAACKAVNVFEEWIEQFKQFLADIHTWCTEQARVRSCYVAPGDDGLRIMIFTRGEQYQFAIDDAVSELEIELAREYPYHPAVALHMPESPGGGSRDQYVDVGGAMQVYAGQENPSETG